MAHSVAARVTEQPNVITHDMDVASPTGIVKLLRQSDAQLFAGFHTHDGLLDACHLNTLYQFASVVETIVNHAGPKDVIVCSGAGTSGRLAHFAARTFNRVLAAHGRTDRLFRYLCAGGDASLLVAQENAEDNPRAAEDDLEAVLPLVDADARVLYVGITCGLSATYVGAQLAFCFERPDVCCALVGFNPTDAVKPVAIRGWDLTFTDIVARMSAGTAAGSTTSWGCPKHLLVNPVVGPESVTGSTRMKGGSATKIVVETAFHVGTARAVGGCSHAVPALVDASLAAFANAVRAAYLPLPSVADVVTAAGRALAAGGRVVYVGVDSGGIIGVIDASECPPTFGATFDDVRGFVVSGYDALASHPSAPFNGPAVVDTLPLDATHCADAVLPALTANDVVVLMGIGASALQTTVTSLGDALHAATTRGVAVAKVLVRTSVDDVAVAEPLAVTVTAPASDSVSGLSCASFAELSLKLVLNAVSTGGHVIKGAVYHNRMVALQLSNVKLFHRATSLVCALAGVDEDAAVTSLLRVIYAVDDVPAAVRAAAIADHIEVATKRLRVVPLALILCKADVSIAEAQAQLAAQPVIRTLLAELLHTHALPE